MHLEEVVYNMAVSVSIRYPVFTMYKIGDSNSMKVKYLFTIKMLISIAKLFLHE